MIESYILFIKKILSRTRAHDAVRCHSSDDEAREREKEREREATGKTIFARIRVSSYIKTRATLMSILNKLLLIFEWNRTLDVFWNICLVYLVAFYYSIVAL